MLDAAVASGKGRVRSVGHTFEAVVVMLTSRPGAAVLLEFAQADGGQGRGGVVLGRIVVRLVDWHRSMHHVRLDRLLVDDGLVGLVNVAK